MGSICYLRYKEWENGCDLKRLTISQSSTSATNHNNTDAIAVYITITKIRLVTIGKIRLDIITAATLPLIHPQDATKAAVLYTMPP
jgi:hypothetical protein